MKKLLCTIATLALVLGMSTTAFATESVTLPLGEDGTEITFSSVSRIEEASFSYFAYDSMGGGEFTFDGTIYYLAEDCTFDDYTLVGYGIERTYSDDGEEVLSCDLEVAYYFWAPVVQEGFLDSWASGDLYVMMDDVIFALETEEVTEDAEEVAEDAEEVTEETTEEVAEDAEEVTEETTEEVAEDAEEVTEETTEEVAEEVVEEVADLTAAATSSTVLVDGEEVAFEAYNIADNNYFKLRDVAAILSGSAAQFEVTWDGDLQAIDLITGEAYTEVGGELATGDGLAKTAISSTATIYLDGVEVELTAYTINDNNYFKLRDLGEAMDFNVSWDDEANSIVIASDEAYTAD